MQNSHDLFSVVYQCRRFLCFPRFQIQNAAYKGTVFFLSSKPKFFAEAIWRQILFCTEQAQIRYVNFKCINITVIFQRFFHLLHPMHL